MSVGVVFELARTFLTVPLLVGAVAIAVVLVVRRAGGRGGSAPAPWGGRAAGAAGAGSPCGRGGHAYALDHDSATGTLVRVRCTNHGCGQSWRVVPEGRPDTVPSPVIGRRGRPVRSLASTSRRHGRRRRGSGPEFQPEVLASVPASRAAAACAAPWRLRALKAATLSRCAHPSEQ